ncbi:hypothetical protein SDRG_15029 [Saprolegnia diclina VS20]|uniref:RING-type domain-containing protein n=1 Tax=Saprolegnia diclina (strain VS20) TaxID=1156394 RepID=T0R4V8_SAPDV|nr:hypothetical protein SDRG_15029 [Saprolegnia diclina VS20]EQC27128.1 hypothetical protein SDRG_15029 [Saprolegnia diclina VS20]|eukprot:XP_008619414.1 hypothetical protein SDRG_15029 [Saprolegnia diclina VS20]
MASPSLSPDTVQISMAIAPTPAGAPPPMTQESQDALLAALARTTLRTSETPPLPTAAAAPASPHSLRQLEEDMVRSLPQSPRARPAWKPSVASAAVHNSPRACTPSATLPSPAAAEENCCLICMDDFTERRRPYPLPCVGACTGASVHYRCIMAWLGQSGSCPLCRGPCDPLAMEPTQTLDFTDLKATVLRPVPLDAGIVRCYVKQVYKGLFKQYGYELYLQGRIGTDEPDRFLLAAKKQLRKNMTANYAIYTTAACDDASRVGRMGSNFLGTVFTLYDNGRDPQKVAKIQDATNGQDALGPGDNVLQIREELGCCTYEANRTSVGPRKMRVCIPDVDEAGRSSKVVRPTNQKDRIVSRMGVGELTDLIKFINREPVFREDLGAYCLDFGGRVSMASVKNFQLISADDPAMGNVLQFGRVADDMFTMDFQWPLSPFQAFAICLSSCDTKLACV